MSNNQPTRADVRAQFGPNAAAYATSPTHAKGASRGRLVDLLAPQPTERALDVATGAGHMAFALAPHVHEVIASDVTPQMLDVTAAGAAERGLDNLHVQEADAEALPFDDASFNIVTCRIAPHHFPHPERFVCEAARVLRAGGRFGLVDNIVPDGSTSDSTPGSTPGASTSSSAGAAAAINAWERRRDPSHARALSVSEWIAQIEAAGLAIEARETMGKTMDFGIWCDNLRVELAVRDELAAWLEATEGIARAFLQPRRIDGALHFRLVECVMVARKP